MNSGGGGESVPSKTHICIATLKHLSKITLRQTCMASLKSLSNILLRHMQHCTHPFCFASLHTLYIVSNPPASRCNLEVTPQATMVSRGQPADATPLLPHRFLSASRQHVCGPDCIPNGSSVLSTYPLNAEMLSHCSHRLSC